MKYWARKLLRDWLWKDQSLVSREHINHIYDACVWKNRDKDYVRRVLWEFYDQL